MTTRRCRRASLALLLAFASFPLAASRSRAEPGPAEPFRFEKGDRVAYIGNTLADRMQHHGWLETYIHAAFPEHELVFRNLGFSADEVTTRTRSENFGSPNEWLTKVEADVVFCFFGRNEALRGEEELDKFRGDLAAMLDDMLAQKYNGESAPRLVVFSPIAQEDLKSPHLPDGKENNAKLALYTRAMGEVCAAKNVRFVDIFTPSQRLYASAPKALTLNGVHLLDHGDRALARVILRQLFAVDAGTGASEAELARIREAVLDKNYQWFSRYRVVDGYNVFGGRSRLAWFGQSNADVMRREMEIFDIKTANRDERIWAVAKGGDLEVKDDNFPPELTVRTNKPGPLDEERHPYLDGVAAMEKMTVAEGMEVNLFASEDMFPEMVNPVQMAVDTDSRLFVVVWPSYPHWNPTKPRTDRILCLPDDDRDGVADRCIVFADELNSVTGFEFWGGGMLVAALPEIWFLKDTDGDDKADLRIRMLQGVSSADTHHSANAMVVGPDGWLYWSRGIFNVCAMETPTTTFRSGRSGVYRFNPRTFEMEFHFPIGPNPHGDVFDQWGYQFANDGTGGTGSYVNLGKGIGNKQWFQKRVRPVAATGILSSSHFPEKNQGNFLICNTIGFLGVLQHEVKYDGADITAVEIEPIVYSSDPNFRPTDLEVGGDGALYVSDWCNVLIGHMQHNMRDPNRDDEHGRVYRFTAKGRPLLEPVKLKGKPIPEVLRAFFAKENGTRYRARLELSGRDSKEVIAAVARWTRELSPGKPAEAQALLECLWVHEEHRVPNIELAKKVFRAEEPRVRAAAVRTLGHWGLSHGEAAVPGWGELLVAGARDESALVRAEAVKAAVEFPGLTAAETVFEVAARPLDAELTVVLDFARGQLQVDRIVDEAVKSGAKLSPAAEAYVLRNASVEDLLALDPTPGVYRAVLSRENASTAQLRRALEGLAKLAGADPLDVVLALIDERAAAGQTSSLPGLGQLLQEQPRAQLLRKARSLEKLATEGVSSEARRAGYAAWIAANGNGDDAFLAATTSKERLLDFLEAVPLVADESVRGSLYSKVAPLLQELPVGLGTSETGSSLQQQGIQVDYFHPNPNNVAIETLARMTPRASGVVPEIVMNVPQRKEPDGFALRFTGVLHVPKSGKYDFWTNSDDGSRLYIGDRLVVDNDGLHGMVEKRGSIDLPAGGHPIVVTYFDNGGGDGLVVTWRGPGFRKQRIAPERLTVTGGETLHDVAIRALTSIPGHDERKFADLSRLVRAGKHRASAVAALRTVPETAWSEKGLPQLVDNLVGYLSEMPASYRTGAAATEAMELAKALGRKLPAERASALEARLQNLDVRIIAIGTVPQRMIFDKERLAVAAGKPVEFRFSNTDEMPHNFAVTRPGSLEEVGLLGEATANDPDAMARGYIPKSDEILVASRLLQPGESQAISFEVPKTPGVYPYVCTYPGHWRRMYGALYVVEDLEAYLANPEAYLAANPLEVKDELLAAASRGREWTYDDLIGDVSPLPAGRSFEVGKEVFKVASCLSCHRLNDEGQVFGPDLATLDPKKRTVEHVLRSLVEPSAVIDDQFSSYAFVTATGQVVTGMIVEETNDEVKVVIDPLAKDRPTVVPKAQILQRSKMTSSIMPEGLLSRLSREEILDLLAYVIAGGDPKAKFYGGEHAHHDH